MCGRYASFRQAQELADAFGVEETTEAARAVAPSYNVAPTQPVRIVLDRVGSAGAPVHREMHAARWGLVPAWAKDLRVGYTMINARRESLDDRPAFRVSLQRRRCVVPADGYYEWQRHGGAKTPYFIHAAAGAPIAFAGLYAFWRDPGRADDDPARWVLSTTIVTTAAGPELAGLHDRVPVVLDAVARERWLDPGLAGTAEALHVLDDPAPHLAFHRVSDRVNRVAEDEPSLIDPV
jgi:putative SOS response-associated peptidase YedK